MGSTSGSACPTMRYVTFSTAASGFELNSVRSSADVIVKSEKREARETVTLLDKTESSPTSKVCARRSSSVDRSRECAVTIATLAGRGVVRPEWFVLYPLEIKEAGVSLPIAAKVCRGRNNDAVIASRCFVREIAGVSILSQCEPCTMRPLPPKPVSLRGSFT